MAVFFLGTLYALLRGACGGRRWLLVSVVACLLGMGSKEVMVSAPILALLFDRTFLAGDFASALRVRRAYYLALSSTWVVLIALMWARPHGDSIGLDLGVGTIGYGLSQAGALLVYLKLLVWPQPLLIDYGITQVTTVADTTTELLAIVLLLAATIHALVRRPILGFVGAWFFIILAPTSSLIPLLGEVAAERRMYLPSMALLTLSVVLVWLVLQRFSLQRIAPVVLAVAGLAFFGRTWERNEDFRSAESIWRSVLEVRPDNARARTSLGVALADEGRFPAAIALYKQSLNQWPTYADAHYNLANALLESGDSEQAVEHYRRAIKNAPDDARAHVNLGTALGRMGKHQESASHYLEALRLDPDFALAHNNLAIALRSRGEVVAALQHFQQAVRLQPEYATAQHNLAAALERQGHFDEAIVHYRLALHLRPDFDLASRRLEALLSQQGGH